MLAATRIVTVVSDTNENELLRRQLRELEARVARLEEQRVEWQRVEEQQLRAQQVGAAVPPPVAPQVVSPVAPVVESTSEPRPLPAMPPPIPDAVAPSGSHAKLPQRDRGPAETHRARAERESRDLEHFIGLAVLGRVGIAAVVLAAAYFGQLGWAQLGPAARAALVYVFGAALIALGTVLRRHVDQRYVALMWGGGVAVTYVAGVLAHLRYEVMPSWVAVVSLLLTAALGQFLAHRLRLEIFATVALGGAYLAPVLVGTPSPTPTAFFVLLLALHSWAAWTEHRWQWHSARMLAVIATLMSVAGWYSENDFVSPWSFLWHMQAVWLLIALPELVRAALRQPVAARRIWAVFGLGLVFCLASTCPSTMVEHSALVVGAVLLVAGAWFVTRSVLMGQCLARIPAFLLGFGVVRWWWANYEQPREHEWVLIVGLALVGLLQLGVRRWTQVGELGTAIAASLALFSLASTGASGPGLPLEGAPLAMVLPLLLLGFARQPIGQITGLLLSVATCLAAVLHASAPPVQGQELVAIALVGATAIATIGTWMSARREAILLGMVATGMHAILLLAWLHYCVRGEPVEPGVLPIPFWNVRFLALSVLVALVAFARSRLPQKLGEQRIVLGIVVLVASYVGGLLEVLDISADWTFGPRAASTTLYSLLFASGLLVAGFAKQLLGLRWTALALFVGVAVKVAAYDLSQAKTPVRVLVTGVLGAVLLVVAWGYARHKRVRSGDAAGGRVGDSADPNASADPSANLSANDGADNSADD